MGKSGNSRIIRRSRAKTRGGYGAKDQYLLETKEGTYLQSYNSIVAFIGNDGKIKVGKDFNYSRTTARYVTQFLNMRIKEIEKDIRDRKITIADLVV